MATPSWFDNKISVGNLLSIVTVVVGLSGGYALLNDTAQRTARAVETLTSIQQAQETRLSVLERRFDDGKANRDRLQAATEEAIASLRADNAKILAQLAAIIARMDAQDKRAP